MRARCARQREQRITAVQVQAVAIPVAIARGGAADAARLGGRTPEQTSGGLTA